MTAFAVLQFPDHIEYLFTSNQRSDKEFGVVKAFIEELLRTLSETAELEPASRITRILQMILPSNKPRIGPYVKVLKENMASCITSCATESADEGNLSKFQTCEEC